MTRVVNFIGGPGAGKSTTAAGLYYELKKRRISCEYVAEYAKDVTWEGTHALLENQLHIFSEQYRRQWRLRDKVDYIITDSPLLLSCVYHPYTDYAPEYVEQAKAFFLATWQQFDNTTFLVEHGWRRYERKGRTQTQAEAQRIHADVLRMLAQYAVPFVSIPPEDVGVSLALQALGL